MELVFFIYSSSYRRSQWAKNGKNSTKFNKCTSGYYTGIYYFVPRLQSPWKELQTKKKPLILAFEANILSNSLFWNYLVIPSRKTQNIIWGKFFLKITNFLLSWYNISIEIACIKTSLLKIMQGPKPFTILGYNNPPNILAYERAKKL